MAKNNRTMEKIKIEIKWALIYIIMGFMWMFLERLLGLHDEHIDQHAYYTMFITIPAILVYVLALLDKRKNYYQGVMSYKQGFISGLMITLIVTLLIPLSQYITASIITPNYFANAIRYTVEKGAMTHEGAMNYFNNKNYIIQGLIGTPVMGIIISAIVSIFTKKRIKP